MSKAPKDLEKALERAAANEARAWLRLTNAALDYALASAGGASERDANLALIDAAKAHTNAAHQTSRCRKWIREATS